MAASHSTELSWETLELVIIISCFGDIAPVSKHFFCCLGTDAKFKGVLHSVLIHACAVPELRALESTEEGLLVGSATTITQLMNKLSALVEQLPGQCIVSQFACVVMDAACSVLSVVSSCCTGWLCHLSSSLLSQSLENVLLLLMRPFRWYCM